MDNLETIYIVIYITYSLKLMKKLSIENNCMHSYNAFITIFFFFSFSVVIPKPLPNDRSTSLFRHKTHKFFSSLMPVLCRSVVSSVALCHAPPCFGLFLLQYTHSSDLKSGFCNIGDIDDIGKYLSIDILRYASPYHTALTTAICQRLQFINKRRVMPLKFQWSSLNFIQCVDVLSTEKGSHGSSGGKSVAPPPF